MNTKKDQTSSGIFFCTTREAMDIVREEATEYGFKVTFGRTRGKQAVRAIRNQDGLHVAKLVDGAWAVKVAQASPAHALVKDLLETISDMRL